MADFNQQASALPTVRSDTTTPSSSSAAAAASSDYPTPPCTPSRPSTLGIPGGYLRQCEQLVDFPQTSTMFEQSPDNTDGLDIVKTAADQAGVAGPNIKRRQQKRTKLPRSPSPPHLGTMDGVMVESHTPVVKAYTAGTESRSSGTELCTSQYDHYSPSDDPYIAKKSMMRI